MAEMSEHDLAALRALDTPTVCNAIELVDPERRVIGFTTEPLVCARPDLPPMVGYAVTATVRAMVPNSGRRCGPWAISRPCRRGTAANHRGDSGSRFRARFRGVLG